MKQSFSSKRVSHISFTAILMGAMILAAPPVRAESVSPESWKAESWKAIESQHFTIFTDGSAKRGVEIAQRLEQFRGVFARLAPSLELQSPAPTTLFAFRDADSYSDFKTRADRGRARTLGQFTRTRDGNYLTLNASASMVGSFSVLYHEYVHFLVIHNFPKVPLWFNEGLAEYYSSFEVDRDRAVLGLPVERHLRWLENEGDFSLDDLIVADSASAAGHDADEVGRFYALSWLLVHYLLSGGNEEIDGIVDYFLRLDEGEDPERAFERAFNRRMSTMAQELRTYFATENFASVDFKLGPSGLGKASARAMAPADALYHLGDLSVHLQKLGQGEKLFQSALDHSPQHGDAHAGLAHLRDLQHRFSEADTLYGDALAGGPSRVLSFLHYGRHAFAMAQGGGEAAAGYGDQARRALGEAIRRLPNFGEAHGLLAGAQSLPGGDLDDALKSILKARSLLPSRMDWVARHIQILLQKRRVDDAEALLQGTLEPQSDNFELIDGLWEDIDRTRLILRSEKAFKAGDSEAGLRFFDEAVSVTTDEDLRLRLELKLEALRAQVESQAKAAR